MSIKELWVRYMKQFKVTEYLHDHTFKTCKFSNSSGGCVTLEIKDYVNEKIINTPPH